MAEESRELSILVTPKSPVRSLLQVPVPSGMGKVLLCWSCVDFLSKHLLLQGREEIPSP